MDLTDPDLAAGLLAELREIKALLADTSGPRPALVDRDEFARLMGLGLSTFDRLKAAGVIGPVAIRVGGGVRWHRAEVATWLARRSPAGDLLDARAWPPVWARLTAKAVE